MIDQETKDYIDIEIQKVKDLFTTLEVKANLDIDSMGDFITRKVREHVPKDEKVVSIESDVNTLKNKIK